MNRQQTKDAFRERLGSRYHELCWLTETNVGPAAREREALLASLKGRATTACRGSKIYTGHLSPGCLSCGEGTWACLYFGRACTRRCFFCPQPPGTDPEPPPHIGDLLFPRPEDFLPYLVRLGIRGVGFSGGESLLRPELLLEFVRTLRAALGPEIYLWLYTNGDRLDDGIAGRLRAAGLDEIRINLSARGYDLSPVATARRHFSTVTVEIPALPEDRETVLASLEDLGKLGVTHVNLHQLLGSPRNFPALSGRRYTFLHQDGVPVLESERTALEILRGALDRGVTVPLHYCSAAYKDRYQERSQRLQPARALREEGESLTDAGYLRRLAPPGARFSLSYVVASLSSQAEAGATAFLPGERIFARKMSASPEMTLSPAGQTCFRRVYLEGRPWREATRAFVREFALPDTGAVSALGEEQALLRALAKWETLPEGFPELF